MNTTKRLFQYINGAGIYQAGIVATSESEVVKFIEDLGFKCNETTTANISKVFGDLKHNVFNYYFTNGAYEVSTLKPSGISTGWITFAPTEFSTIEEYLEDKKARMARYLDICKEIRDAAMPVCKRLGGESKQNVSITASFGAIKPTITLWIEWNGYWDSVSNCRAYLDDRVRTIDMETLMTDNGMNIFDELKTLK